MNGLWELALWGLLAAPVAGAIASAAGTAWGNVLTAVACIAWACLVIFGSGGFSGPMLGITATVLVGVAVAELALAVELRRRQAASRPDGMIRAASALLALGAPVIVIVFAMLLFSAWISSL
jgi:hypothetical protein